MSEPEHIDIEDINYNIAREVMNFLFVKMDETYGDDVKTKVLSDIFISCLIASGTLLNAKQNNIDCYGNTDDERLIQLLRDVTYHVARRLKNETEVEVAI